MASVPQKGRNRHYKYSKNQSYAGRIRRGKISREHLIELLQKSEITTIAVDALGIAEECGSAKAVNVVLLGVLASKLTEIPQSVWYESLKSVIPAKLYEINEKAFQKGLSV